MNRPYMPISEPQADVVMCRSSADAGGPRTDMRALLGEAVWLAVVNHGMTQTELAETLGVSQKHVSEVVNGLSGKPEFFDRVAALFGMTWEVRLVCADD